MLGVNVTKDSFFKINFICFRCQFCGFFILFVCLIFETILKVHLYVKRKISDIFLIFGMRTIVAFSRLYDSKNSSFLYFLQSLRRVFKLSPWISGMIFSQIPEVKILRSFMYFMGSFIGYLSSLVIFIVTMKGLVVLDFNQSNSGQYTD